MTFSPCIFAIGLRKNNVTWNSCKLDFSILLNLCTWTTYTSIIWKLSGNLVMWGVILLVRFKFEKKKFELGKTVFKKYAKLGLYIYVGSFLFYISTLVSHCYCTVLLASKLISHFSLSHKCSTGTLISDCSFWMIDLMISNLLLRTLPTSNDNLNHT